MSTDGTAPNAGPPFTPPFTPPPSGQAPGETASTRGAPMATEASVCPVCSQAFEPMPFYRERGQLYKHLKGNHDWSAEQVDELRGKPKAKPQPRPTGKVDRPPARPKKAPPAAVLSGSDFSRRVQRMGEVAPRIATSGNQLLLQGMIMLGWFPPPLLVEFRSEPQTGIPFPQWDRPTEFGRAVMLDDREVMVYAAAWAFSENTAAMDWLEAHIGTIAPAAAALACAAVTFAHLRQMRALAKAPAVVAFRDQFKAAMAEVQRQAQAQAQAPQAEA